MKRTPPLTPEATPLSKVQPSPENAALALRDAGAVMAPLALWLLRHGVSHVSFSEMLKRVFVDAARMELVRAGAKPTQSALSVLSGVHRKDVRALEQAPAMPSARVSLPSQVFTRWLTDRRLRGADGRPRALPRTGPPRSFESLCREISNDVHPRTVLDELLRLGLVGIDGDRVVVLANAFVPADQLGALDALFAANLSDHIAAAVSNITLDAPKYLEQSVFADGLTTESVDMLHRAARQIWAGALESLVTQAQARVDHDTEGEGIERVRFGVYFYSAPVPEGSDPAPASASPRRRSAPTPQRPRAKSKP